MMEIIPFLHDGKSKGKKVLKQKIKGKLEFIWLNKS